MRVPGVIRKLDGLGRIVIPQEMRKSLGLQEGDEVEIQLENGVLQLRKFAPGCVFCGGSRDLVTYENKHICGECLQKIRKV